MRGARLGTTSLTFAYVAALALVGMPARASADVFGPISLASESPTQQALYAHDPAISGNGRYVVFDGYFGGRTGVWRRDMQTGEVQPVAVQEPENPAISAPDAELPSVSAEGRYVSFTTTAALSPGDRNEGPDVYVRDMDVAATEAGAYKLVSAVSGGEEGLSYHTENSAQAHEYGSVAAGRTAMSANGRYVVFVTTASSDLMPERPTTEPRSTLTPALQVAVRDLFTDETKLVSVRDDPATGEPVLSPQTGEPEPVSGEEEHVTRGAVYYGVANTSPGFEPPKPRRELTSLLGASISADGSTVAWMGDDIAEQAMMLPQEHLAIGYDEPLWRRIGEGPPARTRRVTGGSDPENPACAASGETSLPTPVSAADPCQGPFNVEPGEEDAGTWKAQHADDFIPRLSGDGYTVAFLAEAPLVSAAGTVGENVTNGDVFLADMQPGLTRDQALRRLTEEGDSGSELATSAPIVDLGISASGSQVAFATRRTQFPLGSPAYITAPAPVPGMMELFEIDLAEETLTRVSVGYEGGAGEHPHEEVATGVDPYNEFDGALSPSFSEGGETLAFSSTASNLVYGDGNSVIPGENGRFEGEFDGSDAFVVSRMIFRPQPTPDYVSPAPGIALRPAWRLGVTSAARRNGTVVLSALVPGAGKLSAGAHASLVVTVKARRGHGSARRAKAHRAVVSRSVSSASASTKSPEGGPITLTLKLAPSYRPLAERRGGLSASVNVTFVASGHPTLRQSLAVTFRDLVAHPAKKRRGRSAKRSRTAKPHGGARGGSSR